MNVDLKTLFPLGKWSLLALSAILLTSVSAVAEGTFDPDRLAQIALQWAPIHLQDVDRSGSDALGGKSDYLTAIDYDGDWDTSNNWEALSNHAAHAAAYYSVVHTQDYAFIIYAFYHPRDWVNDKSENGSLRVPAILRGSVSKLGAHENDLEGLLAVVRRKPNEAASDGELLATITVFHRDFYGYTSPRSSLKDGDEDIDGSIHRQKDSLVWRMVSAQEAGGHGLKMYPDLDLEPGDQPDGIRYLPSLVESQEPRHADDRDVRYKLVSIFEPGGLWDQRENQNVFEKPGIFFGDGKGLKHHAAHAPWRWDDKDDGDSLQGGELALDPLAVCKIYFSDWPIPLVGQSYLFNPYRD